MINYSCDICKKEIPKDTSSSQKSVPDSLVFNSYGVDRTIKEYQLCENCKFLIETFINGLVKEIALLDPTKMIRK